MISYLSVNAVFIICQLATETSGWQMMKSRHSNVS